MSNSRLPPVLTSLLAPAAVPEHTGVVPYRASSAPTLPASSGAFFGTRKYLLKKDTELVELYALYLKARAAQYNAANELLQSREACEITAGRLANIDVLKQHEFRRGQHDRQQDDRAWQHQDELSSLQRQTQLLQAETALLQAKAQLAEQQKFSPQPEASDRALSVDDLEELVAHMPEFSVDGGAAFLRMARGLLAEKRAVNGQ